MASEGGLPYAMMGNERLKIRTSAYLAQKLYPGPVGELIFRELMIWEDFGYRFGNGGLIDRLVKHIDAELNNRGKD